MGKYKLSETDKAGWAYVLKPDGSSLLGYKAHGGTIDAPDVASALNSELVAAQERIAKLEAALKPFVMLWQMYQEYKASFNHPLTFNQWLQTDVTIDMLVFEPIEKLTDHASETDELA